MTGRSTALLLATLVVVGAVPAGSVAALGGLTAGQADSSSVNVTTGDQLSTVLEVTSDDVQTEVEATAFELEVERNGDADRAATIAARAAELRERAEAIREGYVDTTEAYRQGDVTKSEYARRLATLNARASNVLRSFERLQRRAATVSDLELRAAGYNRTEVRQALADLDTVTGAGAAALLARFTGETDGEVTLETQDGLSITVEREDGELSRELERPQDDSSTLRVDQSAALATARSALSSPDEGQWTLTSSRIDTDDGVYEFAFDLRAANTTGEAAVAVDGSSGEVFSLEEEIEPLDEDEDEETEEDGGTGELALVVSSGDVAPNGTVTLRALADGEPAAGVTISVDDEQVGTTGPDGTLTLTLPESDEVEVAATDGNAEAELEFEFPSVGEPDESFARKFDLDAALDGDTVTIAVTFNRSGVANATVLANDEAVATTAEDGTASFTIANGTSELEVTIIKGEFEAESDYLVENGTLTLVEERVDGDDGSTDEESETESDDGDQESDAESSDTESS